MSTVRRLLSLEKKSTQAVRIDSKKKLSHEELVLASVSKATMLPDLPAIKKAAEYVQYLATSRRAVYGVTTSFGGNIHHIIPPEQAELLQRNLILSHATNVGELFPYEICRAAFILRFHMLGKGYSGLQPETFQLGQKLIELGITPAIKMHGSVGASGDIAPLASIGLVLIGEGNVWLPDRKTLVPTGEAFKKYALKPITLSYKEGLALLNGTSMMTSVASFSLTYLKRLLENSLLVSALSLEALGASSKPFDVRLHALKPHRYEINTARFMSEVFSECKLIKTHSELKQMIEDELKEKREAFYSSVDLQGGSYSLRAIPQVYHPILNTFAVFRETVNTEINAVDDNPLLLPDEQEELHGANFHGYPIAVASDSMNFALVGVSNMALARIDRLLKSHHSGLPWFLATGQEGLYLGMHGIQFTAAGIGAELRNLAHPTSITQIPTNNDNQDFGSFGHQSTTKGLEMITLASYIMAIEWMCAVQGIWLRLQQGSLDSSTLSPFTGELYEKALTIYCPATDQDQMLSEKTEALAELLLMHSFAPKPLSNSLWS
jgi:histidine ammonia-lyase